VSGGVPDSREGNMTCGLEQEKRPNCPGGGKSLEEMLGTGKERGKRKAEN
jgi:hypothetical protein